MQHAVLGCVQSSSFARSQVFSTTVSGVRRTGNEASRSVIQYNFRESDIKDFILSVTQ